MGSTVILFLIVGNYSQIRTLVYAIILIKIIFETRGKSSHAVMSKSSDCLVEMDRQIYYVRSRDTEYKFKVRDEIEQLMDHNCDMAEMYLSEKKRRSDNYPSDDLGLQTHRSSRGEVILKSAPASPSGSISRVLMLQRALNSIGNLSKHENLRSSSISVEKIQPLEMLLETYFFVIDNTITKSLTDNIKNQLIQFELVLTATTLIDTVFATVTAVFGMNFDTTVSEDTYGFNLVLIITGVSCAFLHASFIVCFRYKKMPPA